MNRKKRTVILFIGILSGMFIIMPTLNFLGIPTFNDFLTAVFGEDNPWAVLVAILVICLVMFSVYRRPKN